MEDEVNKLKTQLAELSGLSSQKEKLTRLQGILDNILNFLNTVKQMGQVEQSQLRTYQTLFQEVLKELSSLGNQFRDFSQVTLGELNSLQKICELVSVINSSLTKTSENQIEFSSKLTKDFELVLNLLQDIQRLLKGAMENAPEFFEDNFGEILGELQNIQVKASDTSYYAQEISLKMDTLGQTQEKTLAATRDAADSSAQTAAAAEKVAEQLPNLMKPAQSAEQDPVLTLNQEAEPQTPSKAPVKPLPLLQNSIFPLLDKKQKLGGLPPEEEATLQNLLNSKTENQIAPLKPVDRTGLMNLPVGAIFKVTINLKNTEYLQGKNVVILAQGSKRIEQKMSKKAMKGMPAKIELLFRVVQNTATLTNKEVLNYLYEALFVRGIKGLLTSNTFLESIQVKQVSPENIKGVGFFMSFVDNGGIVGDKTPSLPRAFLFSLLPEGLPEASKNNFTIRVPFVSEKYEAPKGVDAESFMTLQNFCNQLENGFIFGNGELVVELMIYTRRAEAKDSYLRVVMVSPAGSAPSGNTQNRILGLEPFDPEGSEEEDPEDPKDSNSKQ